MIAGLLGRRRPKSAAQWFAARRANTDPAFERQFERWLAQERSHGEEYAVCEILWEVSADAARGLPKPARARRSREWFARLGAAFAASGVLVLLSIWLWTPSSQRWSTGAGEQRTLVLDDGSRVRLNTRTRIDVRFASRSREVVLDGGEAFFEVAKDSSRPFTVRTPLGYARAVGTHFNIYLVDHRLAVTTEEGAVLVAAPSADNGVLVTVGRRAELRAGMPRASVAMANLTRDLDWMTQRLEVDDVPLESVLSDFSRYTVTPVRADTREIAALRVSAVLRTGDMAALAATLKGALGLELEHRGDEIIVVAAKQARASPRR
jgi:transmembrane sensor